MVKLKKINESYVFLELGTKDIEKVLDNLEEKKYFSESDIGCN